MGILEELANAPQEGQETDLLSTETETPASPPEAETKEEVEETPSSEGSEQTEKRKPLHEDPVVQDYLNRQIDKRAKELEEKHQTELQKIRDELAPKTKETPESNDDVPDWFGGDDTAWSKFQAYLGTMTRKAKQEAIQELQESKSTEARLMQEATEYMNTEVANIENDKEMNPDGVKIDINRLGVIVDKFHLVDPKTSKWNWRGAWEIYKMQLPKAKEIDLSERKKLAATSSSNRAEEKTPVIFSSKDFRRV